MEPDEGNCDFMNISKEVCSERESWTELSLRWINGEGVCEGLDQSQLEVKYILQKQHPLVVCREKQEIKRAGSTCCCLKSNAHF